MMTFRTLQIVSYLTLMFLLLVSAGCQSPAAQVTPEPVEQDTPLPAPTDAEVITPAVETPAAGDSTEQPEPQTGTDPLLNCPREEAGKRLYISELDGFCFLYPDILAIEPDELRPEEVVKLVGPREEGGPKQMELARLTVWVASNGPADVATSAAYAQKWRDLYISPMEPAEITQESSTLGGFPAEVLNGLPGMILQQAGFVVANGYKYSLKISPAPGFVTELDEPVRQAWETIAGTIHFFPPILPRQVKLASEVCPQPAAGTRLLLVEAEGFCFLYPEDFELNPIFYGRVEGGPNLGNWEGFENVRVSLTLGSYPLLAEDMVQSPRDMLAQRVDVVADSVEDRTIGGARAVVYRNDPPGGPWSSRLAIIMTDEQRLYTIVNDPWEPDRWPESVESFNAVWDTVTGSLAFFTPWQ